jgi:hypothetical protein
MRCTVLAVVLLSVAASPLIAQGEAPTKERAPTGIEAKAWDRFHDYPELVELLEQIAQHWPAAAKLSSIGKSYQGRTLWLLTVTNPATGPAESKPAMYVDANIHGNEVQGSEAAIYTVWYLLKNAPAVPKLQELLDRVTFYVVPTVNPDGRAYWFQAANTSSSSRGGQMPTDNDGDGLYDEDPPDDLDGDGHLTMMRKKLPGQGNYKLDPEDPREMLPCKPGEKGDWILLGQEGIDDDGDGRVNEDGPGGYDPNRDFGSDWQPSWIQYGARPHPWGLPESRAVRDFLLSHPNVAGVQAFHNAGGMILRGPGDQSMAFPAADLPVYDEIGRAGEKMLPFYRYMVLWKDLYTVHGGFIDWTYLGLGIVTFSNELWSSVQLSQGAPLDGKARREWFDRQAFDAYRVPWKPYEHPTYGAIEIGGTVKNTSRIPPGFLIQEMLHRNGAFVLYQASELPELVVDVTRVEPCGGDLSYLTATLRNARLTPTRTAQAASKKIGQPDLLHAKAEGVTLLRVARPRDRFRPELASLFDDKTDPTRLQLEQGIGPRGELSLVWLVKGKGKVAFRYQAAKAKDLEFVVEVK